MCSSDHVLSRPPFPVSPGAPPRGDTQVFVGEVGPERWAAVTSPGVGGARSVGYHGNTTGLAPGATGFQEVALSLPPRGSPTLALLSFHPWPTKQ